jgi:Tol biopolymer transport system component
MIERFGPWSSALNDGLSPQLSTFWRSRLTQLASVRAARDRLTRRDWLRLGAIGTAACALPTFHLASADGQEDAKPAPTGKIYVYAGLKTGPGAEDSEWGVFAIDPRTAAWTRIIAFGGNVRVSRDGRRLALIRAGKSMDDGKDIDGVGVWTIDSEGKAEKTQVSDFSGVTSWSPDGKQLIVVKWVGKPSKGNMRFETWRFNADGSGAIRLPIPDQDEVDDWSPDGRWLVTVSDRNIPDDSGYQLYIMRPDGTDERRLTEDRGLNVYNDPTKS